MESYIQNAVASRLMAFVNNENTDLVRGLTEAEDCKVVVSSEYAGDVTQVWKTFTKVAFATANFKDVYGGTCSMDIILVVDAGSEANKIMADALVRRIQEAMVCSNMPICLVDVADLEHMETAVRFPYQEDESEY